MASPAGSLAPVPRWKTIVIRALVGGAACGMVIATCLAALYFYFQRPKGWDKTSTRALNVKAEPISRLIAKNDRFEEVSTGIIFSVDLENTTSDDITVPKSLTVMQEAKNSRALHWSSLKFDRDVFIPAHHTVSASLENDDLCVSNYDPKACFELFKNDDFIVLLDNFAKSEIRIPIPTLTIPQERQANFPK